jgi:hypothetical protein
VHCAPHSWNRTNSLSSSSSVVFNFLNTKQRRLNFTAPSYNNNNTEEEEINCLAQEFQTINRPCI